MASKNGFSNETSRGHNLARTTPFPNLLLDELMPRLRDTEWRLLCVIVRQTQGWFDASSGERKSSDWMTRQQMLSKTGRNSEAVSRALDNLIRQHLVQARNKEGKDLATAQQRRQTRGPIFYALHPTLMSRLFPPVDNTPMQVARGAETEHEQALASSVFEGQATEIELGEARKANGTKENTKQTRQKPTVHEGQITREDFPLLAETQGRARRDELSKPAREALTTYEKGFKSRYPDSHPARPSPEVAAQLERCCETHGSGTLLQLLPTFFGSDRPVFVRHRHSLQAFLSSLNLLLYGLKGTNLATGKLRQTRISNKGMSASGTGAEALIADEVLDWNGLSQRASLNPLARRFVGLYLKRYRERFPGKTPPLPYISALRRLDRLLQRYPERELARLLDAYFASDWAQIKAQQHSIEAFAHNADLLEIPLH